MNKNEWEAFFFGVGIGFSLGSVLAMIFYAAMGVLA
jgi:hypothetical protein